MKVGVKALLSALIAASCLLPAPVAAAAVPANDDFANAEGLGSALPVQIQRLNYGATKELGDPVPGTSIPTGHSVWFKWTAADNGFVTVNTCKAQSYFPAVLGVYTGTALGSLAEVAVSFVSQGPDCPADESGGAVAFKAVAGVEYEIFVDGYQRFPEEEEATRGQGEFRLTLEELPVPANDDFAGAARLKEETLWNGAYTASADGYNWGAGKEAGEPNHAGDQGGASVWYSWTAPSTAIYGLTACGPFASRFGVYTGSSLTALTAVIVGDCSGMALLTAQGGTTYRIAVDGKYDAGSASAAMGSIHVHLFREPPGAPQPRREPLIEAPFRPRDSIDTRLRRRKIDSQHRRATFFFGATQTEARFRCQLDKRKPAWCKSPRTYKHLKPGPHTFKVIAIDSTSHGDGTPPVAQFRIRGESGK